MDKAVIVITGIVIIVGGVFVLKNFYNPFVETPPTSTISDTPPLQPFTLEPPTASSGVLDRIEAAIRAKLKK